MLACGAGAPLSLLAELPVSETYTREQRQMLETALRRREELRCPACGSAMTRQDVVAPANVPYVRHRVWLLCLGCRRSISLDAAR